MDLLSFAVGGIVGAIVTIPISIWTGHRGNRITERQNRKSLQAKQKQFIDGLSSVGRGFIYSSEINEEEITRRRSVIKQTVLKLSKEIFEQEYPDIPSFRPEDTVYPKLPCKWCKRAYAACVGSKGECQTCALPLDLWLGSQGEKQE